MSKQPHDQDEQQAPAGADSASSASSGTGNGGGGTGKAGSGRRRSRRYDKGNQDKANPRQGQAGGAEAQKPASGAAASGGDAGKAASSDKTTPPAGQASSTDKAADSKPAETRAAGNRPVDTKAADTKAATPSGTKTPSGDTAKKAEAPKPASTAGGGKGSTASSGGDGQQRKGGKAGLLALVLVILLAIGVLLFGWQAWQKLEAQQARIAELEGRTGELASAADLAGLESRLEEGESERDAALDGAIATLQDEFADYRGEVDDTLDRVLAELSSEQQTDERDWLHAEAAYLLRLANQRLQLERDVMGAAALLRTADARLREADNPALVPVRREIARELAALDAVPRVDRTGLWLELDAQRTQIAGQPLSQEVEEIPARSGIEEVPTGAWQQQLSRFGQELKELVVIRQHGAEMETLITPEQETYLRQSVRLVIEQAQLALLKEETELYVASLDKALAMIEGYYDTEASGVRSVIERLGALKGEAIRPELPDISGSQQALASFIEHRFESRRGDDA